MRMCSSTKDAVTLASLASVFTPDGVMGSSLTSSNAPTDNRFANPTLNSVAVSMSMACARVLRKYALNASSCSHTRRLVVYTDPV